MKVVVLGAGVIGVSAAYALMRDGHEVTVIERGEGPGLETSFANGGQISASHAYPWAAPDVPAKLLKWLGRKDAPRLFRLRADPEQWLWAYRFLLNCRRSVFFANAERNLRLALLSRDALRDIRAAEDIAYDHKSLGILHFFHTRRELDKAAELAGRFRALGLRNKVLDRDGVLALEPALAASGDGLVGGIHTPDDESGDAYAFTCTLAERAAAGGVSFRYSETVSALDAEGDRIARLRTDKGSHAADVYVVALACYSNSLLRPLGIRLPIYPTKGYSVTVPVGEANGAPNVSLIDEDHKIVYSRLGERLRVAGTAEFAGYDTTLDRERANVIRDLARAQFPAAGDFDAADLWTGLRPMTPDGGPIIGRTRYANLVLDTGHGTLGWTMASGSARVVADLIAGRTPPVDAAAYGPERFGIG